MSGLPDEMNLQKEEFASQLPWIEPLIRRLNLLAGQVRSAFAGLEIGPNVIGQVETVTFTTSDPVSATFPIYFSVKMSKKPRVLIVGDAVAVDLPDANFVDALFPTWHLVDKDGKSSVKISHITGLVVSTKYQINLLCLP